MYVSQGPICVRVHFVLKTSREYDICSQEKHYINHVIKNYKNTRNNGKSGKCYQGSDHDFTVDEEFVVFRHYTESSFEYTIHSKQVRPHGDRYSSYNYLVGASGLPNRNVVLCLFRPNT